MQSFIPSSGTVSPEKQTVRGLCELRSNAYGRSCSWSGWERDRWNSGRWWRRWITQNIFQDPNATHDGPGLHMNRCEDLTSYR